MSIGLKLKLKSNLKKQIEDEAKSSGGSDTRFLNYWDLKNGEKVKILFVPDTNGELWGKFKKHGPALKVRGVGSVRCSYESSSEDCPACQKGFDFLQLEKDTGDKQYREEAKKWFARDYTVMSCVVLDSPFEVAEAPDHNQVKLIYVPYAIEKLIKEAVTEGQLDEDELCRTPFFIKKGENAGGFAEYTSSYFGRKQVGDDELEFFEDHKVEQYDYTTLDAIPAPTTTEEVQEWLDKAIAVVERAESNGKEGGKKEESEAPRKATSPLTRSKASSEDDEPRRPQRAAEPADEIDEDQQHMGEGRAADKEDTAEDTPQEAPKKTSLRDRLNTMR
jgi:hypothetical protein